MPPSVRARARDGDSTDDFLDDCQNRRERTSRKAWCVRVCMYLGMERSGMREWKGNTESWARSESWMTATGKPLERLPRVRRALFDKASTSNVNISLTLSRCQTCRLNQLAGEDKGEKKRESSWFYFDDQLIFFAKSIFRMGACSFRGLRSSIVNRISEENLALNLLPYRDT